MPQKRSMFLWAGYFAVSSTMGIAWLHADDKLPHDTDQYHFVPIESGGKTSYIRVQKSMDPFRNVGGNENKYNPEAIISRPNPMADKSFSNDKASFGQQDIAEANRTFITSTYQGNNDREKQSMPSLNNKTFATSTASYGRATDNFQKTFTTGNMSATQEKTASFADVAANEQGRTALLGKDKTEPLVASVYANKTYLGPQATNIRHDLDEMNQGLSRMSDLPNRPLTIDEVRALINHETKPNTEAKPEPDVKPLNEVDPKPTPMINEKEADVPSPGMMAARGSSEPLPVP